MESKKNSFSVREAGQVKQRNQLIRLIGEKPMLNCAVDGVQCEALWDTGSMVCLLNWNWAKEKFPKKKVFSVSEFLEGDTLNLCAANNTDVDVEGIMVLKTKIGSSISIKVPFLLTKDELRQPIIGYNVIEYLSKEDKEEVQKSLGENMKNAVAAVNLIRRHEGNKDVKSTQKTIIPPHARCRIKCKSDFIATEAEVSVLFSPNVLIEEMEVHESVSKVHLGRSSYIYVVVVNPTSGEKMVDKGMVLGSVEAISAVIPIFPKGAGETGEVKDDNIVDSDCDGAKWLPECDLTHLPKKKKKVVEEMLKEVCDVFQKDENDNGNIPEFQMDINLEDNIPVSVPHRSIPRQLYEEVKNYLTLEDKKTSDPVILCFKTLNYVVTYTSYLKNISVNVF